MTTSSGIHDSPAHYAVLPITGLIASWRLVQDGVRQSGFT
jgi:hypothetical protein